MGLQRSQSERLPRRGPEAERSLGSGWGLGCWRAGGCHSGSPGSLDRPFFTSETGLTLANYERAKQGPALKAASAGVWKSAGV